MIDYPYSQQIHDKVLADWKDIPFDDFVYEGYFISHPSVNYRLWIGSIGLYPEDVIQSMSIKHGENLLKKLYNNQLEKKRKLDNELATKKFLGLE